MTYALNFPGDVTEDFDLGAVYGPTDETGEYYQAVSVEYVVDTDKTRVTYKLLSTKEAQALIEKLPTSRIAPAAYRAVS